MRFCLTRTKVHDTRDIEPNMPLTASCFVRGMSCADRCAWAEARARQGMKLAIGVVYRWLQSSCS